MRALAVIGCVGAVVGRGCVGAVAIRGCVGAEVGRGWNKATGSSDCDGGDVCVCADSLAQGRLTDMPGPGGMCGVRAQESCSELG